MAVALGSFADAVRLHQAGMVHEAASVYEAILHDGPRHAGICTFSA